MFRDKSGISIIEHSASYMPQLGLEESPLSGYQLVNLNDDSKIFDLNLNLSINAGTTFS